MKFIFSFVGFWWCLVAYSQNIQWASKMIAVSSEKKSTSGKQYKAEQALGKPNVLPAFQNSPCAWSPQEANNNKKEEFIHVGFTSPMSIKQVLVAESFNAGAISQIFAYDDTGKEHLIYKNPQVAPAGKGRLFSLAVPQTPYSVASLKITLQTGKVTGENQIDAIGISDSDTPVEIQPNLGKNQVQFNSEPLSGINSQYLEANPVVLPSGKGIYFTRLNHPENIKDTLDGKMVYKQDIWFAELDDKGNASNPINIGEPLNNRQHNAAFTIAPDESYMLLNNKYLPDGRLEKGLSITYKTPEGKWGKPEILEIEGFESKSDFNEYSLSPDGKVLIISTEATNTLGGNDLYVAFRKDNKSFGKPIHLGNIINSAADEATPYLDTDGKTLYFSSNGFSGYGSFDIFVTQRLDDTWLNWSEPENLGNKINTEGMDIYFAKQGNFGYHSSRGDIYRTRMVEPMLVLKGRTLNEKTQELIPARVSLHIQEINDSPKPLENPEGKFNTSLKIGKKYKISAELQGFFPQEIIIDATAISEYTEMEKDIVLKPMEKDATLRLNNIFFAQAEAVLMPESYPELDELAEVMKKNPKMRIQLEGHTEIYGNKKALKKLSLERTLAIREYLVKKGISKSRIQCIGYGAERPLSTEDTEQARRLNRRVELKIL